MEKKDIKDPAYSKNWEGQTNRGLQCEELNLRGWNVRNVPLGSTSLEISHHILDNEPRLFDSEVKEAIYIRIKQQVPKKTGDDKRCQMLII